MVSVYTRNGGNGIYRGAGVYIVKQVALKAEEAEIAGWKKRAEAAGLGLSAWIRMRCAEEVVAPVAGPELVEHVKLVKKIAGNIRGAKKKQRAAAAESARASVQVPQRRGEMVDVKMAEPNLVAQCRHHHGYGEVCYKCDPKMGYPNIG